MGNNKTSYARLVFLQTLLLTAQQSACFRQRSFPNPVPHSKSTFIHSSSSIDTETQSTFLNQDIDVDNDLQVLRFIEPKSKRPIVLVGCMHYNPASIARAKAVTEQLGENQNLHSVLVESCPTRWKTAAEFRSSLQYQWQYDVYQKFLPNEMQAAAKVARRFGKPVVLGDQAIELTGDRVKIFLKETLKDAMSPLNGGWEKISKDVVSSFDVICTSFGVSFGGDDGDKKGENGKEKLSLIPDYFDKNLVATMPFSFFRYPLSIFVRYPKFAVACTLFLGVLDQGTHLAASAATATTLNVAETATTAGDVFASSSSVASVTLENMLQVSNTVLQTEVSSPWDWIVTLMVFAVESIVFARALAIPILAERDVALARSIVAVANSNEDQYIVEEPDEEDQILLERQSQGQQKQHLSFFEQLQDVFSQEKKN
mmetsp:Transcript_32794/g.48120  ORF Transcript_32794/g.48120 Transcript_32794/m.48120 type:complete len:428 (-) Transcript_32794:139-1422(-)